MQKTRKQRVSNSKKITAAYALRLPNKVYVALKKEAKTNGVTVSFLLNNIIARYLNVSG